MVDELPEDADDFRYPGDAIEPEIQSELERALSGETVLPEKILDTDFCKQMHISIHTPAKGVTIIFARIGIG